MILCFGSIDVLPSNVVIVLPSLHGILLLLHDFLKGLAPLLLFDQCLLQQIGSVFGLSPCLRVLLCCCFCLLPGFRTFGRKRSRLPQRSPQYLDVIPQLRHLIGFDGNPCYLTP